MYIGILPNTVLRIHIFILFFLVYMYLYEFIFYIVFVQFLHNMFVEFIVESVT